MTYRQRILDQIRPMLEPISPVRTALDFGSGDGFFASQWKDGSCIGAVTAVDVIARKNTRFDSIIYDGLTLPFADRSFDLVYAIDVLHHCCDPFKALSDLSRCSGRYLLLKDHTYVGTVGRIALSVLDEVGNRRFGIPSPYLYQKGWQWVEALESSGWQRIALVSPMRCHSGLLGYLTNKLQFMGLWQRVA